MYVETILCQPSTYIFNRTIIIGQEQMDGSDNEDDEEIVATV